MYKIKRSRILVLVAFLVGWSATSYGQKFCKYLAHQSLAHKTETIDLRADTFDVLHYQIDAAFLNHTKDKTIDAVTELRIVKKIAAQSVTVDLLGLATEAVSVNDSPVNFTHQGEKVTADIKSVAIGDTFTLRIEYSGKPQRDPQWGGFYFNGPYAFNLGVGFASDPHNFGRVWFPCFDNFTDRATYTTIVTVDSGYRAYANGILQAETENGDGTVTFNWLMDESIPTYLASVAIAPYEEVTMDVLGIPVVLTSLAKDTANLRESFEHLPQCIEQFIDKYGPHTFDRIGFNMVPFNAGAMEHATNIAYPVSTIANGSKAAETLFAHELAHHWWGNTTTCNSQEEMWLNEGWASYSEALFLESVYGKARYNSYVEENHRKVLQFAHARDGQSLPVSGIGWEHTYGSHVYDKGADMVHTLRGIMGDDAFFNACKSFQQKFKLKDVSTTDMEKEFQNFTSVDLAPFFSQWVKEEGFAHFDFHYIIENNGIYAVNLKQTPRFNNEVYQIPLQLTAFDKAFNRYDTTVLIKDKEQEFRIKPGFDAVLWAIDYDEKISDATTTVGRVVNKSGGYIFQDDVLATILIDSIAPGDSALLYAVHHWAPADGTYGAPEGLILNRQRYYTFDGIWGDYANVSVQFKYSGLEVFNDVYGYLDNELIKITEDSLVLLYRENGNEAWTLYEDWYKVMGSKFDKRGDITITKVRKGQYALGMYDAGLATDDRPEGTPKFKLFPNPASNEVTLEFQDRMAGSTLEVTDSLGQLVKTKKLRSNKSSYVIDISDLAPGKYFVGVISDNKSYNAMPLIIR
jgi:hypothetical protein